MNNVSKSAMIGISLMAYPFSLLKSIDVYEGSTINKDFRKNSTVEVNVWMITLESIFSKKNIKKAVERLGTDKNGASSETYAEELRNFWELNGTRIVEEIRAETFVPDTVIEYEIINNKGKKRIIAKYSNQDRFITRLITQKLQGFYEVSFLNGSQAYQNGKGIQSAVEIARSYIEAGNDTVVELDIQNFFDDIDLAKLLNILRQKTKDKYVIYLIDVYLHILVSNDGEVHRKEKGIVQGSSMSPVLSNIYLQELDLFMENQGYRWIRYCIIEFSKCYGRQPWIPVSVYSMQPTDVIIL